jgi:modification methylase
MIEMWDDCFVEQNSKITDLIRRGRGMAAFEKMHQVLDLVWEEVFRVLDFGGIACVNIGDATRTLDGDFILYPNHSRIMQKMTALGFTPLPAIIWRKQTNAPNKFMGSGMYPPGAYVTLEHEYILILRKGSKREFPTQAAKMNRRESAYFWEERNHWFSDVWMDLKGIRQKLTDKEARKRSGAYPFELPYRLISMFSAKGDTVLDPFMGMGTTMAAAMATGRNSIGFEIEAAFEKTIFGDLDAIPAFANERLAERMDSHLEFVENRHREKGPFKYTNRHYGFPVVTRQEQDLLINSPMSITKTEKQSAEVLYSDTPQPEFCGDWQGFLAAGEPKKHKKVSKTKRQKEVQLQLLD